MSFEWEIFESGPNVADRTVLLLPGGLHRSRSYTDLMAQPALAGVRLIAVTLPGHGGTPPPADFSIENYARLAAGLATEFGCDAVLGFSFGASVALEMVASGAFCGPAVLLGPSLSARDEPGFFRAIVGLGGLLGSLPSAAMLKMMGMATRQARLSDDRRAELLADFRKNNPRIMRQGLHAYLKYLGRHASPAARLCDAGVPAWIVHAEKGDGRLTSEERSTLAACPRISLVTIPGTSYFIPNEEPERVASLLVDALGQVADDAHADQRDR
ncbi:MAG TPA: alpha/beta hydrolase [Streptosporangiaceae bacterium]|jgi:pimeloyl-ACP methyl ester carboxylesterase